MSKIRKGASGKGWVCSDDKRDWAVVYDNGFVFAFDLQDGVAIFNFEQDDMTETEVDLTLAELTALVLEKGVPLDEPIVYLRDPSGARFPILSDMSTFSFTHGDLKIHYGNLGLAFSLVTEDPPIVLEMALAELIEFVYQRGGPA